MLATESLKRLLYFQPGPIVEEGEGWRDRLRELGEAVAAVVPGARVLRPGGSTGPLWLEKGPRAAVVVVTEDGDLADGPLRKMGLGLEQRRRIAALVAGWGKSEE